MSKLQYLVSELVAGDIAKVPGTFENFKKYSMADFKKWLNPILKNDYLEISIVGDIDLQKAIDIVATSFGSMPKRKQTLSTSSKKFILKKAGTIISETYKATTEPRSLACVVWDTSVGKDMRKMR